MKTTKSVLLAFAFLNCVTILARAGCGASSLSVVEPLADEDSIVQFYDSYDPTDPLDCLVYELDLSKRNLTVEQLSCILNNRYQYLKQLHLSNNQLTTLPVEIRQLKNLECLLLSWNRLKELPNIFGWLTNLKAIYLGGNMLRQNALRNISKVPNLLWLDLSYNQLTELAEEFGELFSTLTKLDITGNDLLLQLPKSLLALVEAGQLEIINDSV